MEIIFHIGMGKTGTSSIQKALSDNRENLRAQGVEYLGLWFDMIDPKYFGSVGQREFMRSSSEQMESHASHFLTILKRTSGEKKVNRFIFSNEDIFGNLQNIRSFMNALQKEVDVKLITYARDPREWLPSAYNQWAVYHKVNPGPVIPYQDYARKLISIYALLPRWNEALGDIFLLRPFLKTINVVDDLATVIGVNIDISEERTLERMSTSESTLRAIYNTRFPSEIRPDKFDRAFRRLDFSASPSLDDYVNNFFSFNETDMILAENAEIFAKIKANLGLDLLDGQKPELQRVNTEDLRRRLLEHLLAIVMQQADRITELEKRFHQFSNSESR